jgi:hypothetical protein
MDGSMDGWMKVGMDGWMKVGMDGWMKKKRMVKGMDG